ncbi:MAG: acyl-CoA thioesterase [Proteobacteria bacterium]|nr:MAG: acyl-CoA thioesterase [Pseudomonadota bacterium]
MDSGWFEYKCLITETMIDIMGHLNHARYLTIFEESRWQLCFDKGFSMEKMQSDGIGFVILDAYIRYSKEVKNRDLLTIRTRFSNLEEKIWIVDHEMIRADGTVCATAQLKAGLFDLKARRLANPQASWLERFKA